MKEMYEQIIIVWKMFIHEEKKQKKVRLHPQSWR